MENGRAYEDDNILLNCANTDQKNLKQGYLHFYTKFMYQGHHQPNGYFYQYIK